MKTFNQYVNEETMPFAQTDKGFVGIEDPAVRDNINNLIDGVTAKGFVTPYIGLERISKVLANFHIFLPKYTFAGGDEGVTAFEINQFGPKIGMTDDGQMLTKESSPYYLYFEYRADDDGMFGLFASVVTEDELDELMSDYEDEEDDEDEGEEMNEEKMTDAEMKKREKIVMSMKDNMAGFKKRYGPDAEKVMYATATKQAMSEEEALDEVMATIDHSWSPHGLTAIRDSLNKNKITHQITTMQHPDGTHLSHITSYHPEFASHMTNLAKKSDTYDPKIYVHGVNGEAESDAPFEGSKKKSTPNPENRARQLAKMAAKSAKKKAIKKVMSKQVDEAGNMAAIDSIIKKGRQALDTHNQVATNIGKSYQKSVDNMELNRLASKSDTGGESIRAVSQRPNKINEASPEKLNRYLEIKNKQKGRPGRSAKSMELAIGKLVNNPKYLKVKVPAKEETQIDEISPDLASRYIKKAKTSTRDAYYGSDAKTSGKRKKGINLALMKKWGDKKYGLPEPKVKATEETQIDEALPLQYFALAAKKAKKQPDMRRPFDDIVKNTLKSAKKKQKSEVATEETQIDEGRPSQRHPLEGHPYHKKSNAELLYIAKDAHKAAEAMKSHNTDAENKYRDQANDSATVRNFRERSGMPNWYKKKYGHDTK